MSAENSAAPPRLRGHHFICLQFFRGEGYSPAFVENLSDIVDRATTDDATVAGGADDVCACCPGMAPDGTCLDPQAGEIEVRRLDRLAQTALRVRPGDRLTIGDARARLLGDRVARERWRASACPGCTWADVCSEGWEAFAATASDESGVDSRG